MGWKLNDLTARIGAPEAMIFGLSGYVFRGQGTQHVLYQGFAGDGEGSGVLHELWWSSEGWHHTNLTAQASATPIANAPSGYTFEGLPDGAQQHVVYQGFVPGQGDDGHVHEIWWDEDDKHHNDLTKKAHAQPTLGDPFGYEFLGQHIMYEGDDHHIHWLRWDIDNGWQHTDLFGFPTTMDAPLALQGPTAYGFAAQGTHHVLYIGTDNHVHELWRDSQTWHHNNLTLAARAPLASDLATGFTDEAERAQFVHYRGTDGHIHQLHWVNGAWQWLDMTANFGGPLASSGAVPTGYLFPADGTLHVNYLGADGHIHEYWRDVFGWHHNDLTAATGAPLALSNPTAYAFAAQSTQHVMFVSKDHHVIELFWVPG